MKINFKKWIIIHKPSFQLLFFFLFILAFLIKEHRTPILMTTLLLYFFLENHYRMMSKVRNLATQNQINNMNYQVMSTMHLNTKIAAEFQKNSNANQIAFQNHIFEVLFSQTKLIHENTQVLQNQIKEVSKSIQESSNRVINKHETNFSLIQSQISKLAEEQIETLNILFGQTKLIHENNQSFQKLINDTHTQQVKIIKALMEKSKNENKTHYQQLEQYLALLNQLPFKSPLPPSRSWAISPDFACILLRELQAKNPKSICELGSGLSTLIIASFLKERNSDCIFYSIDENLEYLEKTKETLIQHGLESFVKLIHAPLKGLTIADVESSWYDTETLATLFPLESLDFLLIDGPAQANSPIKQIRYPALPFFKPYMKKNAIALLDDSDREDETKILNEWKIKFSDLKIENFKAEKGAVKLSFYSS